MQPFQLLSNADASEIEFE